MQTSTGEDTRKEYRRPRVDFEREVRTFQNTRHRNVLQMYDFWEWERIGYIAMKKLKGSLGDILYEPEYYHLLQGIRRDETILAELVRQVPPPPPLHPQIMLLMVDPDWSRSSAFSQYNLSRRQT
jgi:hypothetical protein